MELLTISTSSAQPSPVLPSQPPAPRGGYVTFITFPDFESDHEDAYELFARISSDKTAEVELYTAGSFTLAAVGDAGDTALTLDLSTMKEKPKDFP